MSIIDLRFSKLVLRTKPRLTANDAFVLRTSGITVRGRIGRRSAEGTIEAEKGACKSPGSNWTVRKRRTL